MFLGAAIHAEKKAVAPVLGRQHKHLFPQIAQLPQTLNILLQCFVLIEIHREFLKVFI
jgi:hypothetical protein